MRTLIVASLIFALAGGVAHAQQSADTKADARVLHPTFETGTGPLVVVDGDHHNFHKASGRYAPFAELLQNDGFRVRGTESGLTAVERVATRVLVISNALNEVNVGHWVLPTPSAFTPNEIAVLQEWVRSGGSLLLIADHFPFPGAASDLAAAFEFRLINGSAVRKKRGPDYDVFSIRDGSLSGDEIVRGQNSSEAVSRVATFGGSALSGPSTAIPVLRLSDDFEVWTPGPKGEVGRGSPRSSAKGLLQGAALKYGKGRVAVFGEAAMFSAQVQPNFRMGFNAPGAEGNKQFILNLLHWLAATEQGPSTPLPKTP